MFSPCGLKIVPTPLCLLYNLKYHIPNNRFNERYYIMQFIFFAFNEVSWFCIFFYYEINYLIYFGCRGLGELSHPPPRLVTVTFIGSIFPPQFKRNDFIKMRHIYSFFFFFLRLSSLQFLSSILL